MHEQVVTALPEVSTRQRSADDLCIVLASDGFLPSQGDKEVGEGHEDFGLLGSIT